MPQTDMLHKKAVDPTVNDDSSNDFFTGNEWENTVSGVLFECLDDSVGAAVWANKTKALEGGGGIGQYYQIAETSVPVSTTGGPVIGLTLTTDDLPAGNYKAIISFLVNNTNNNGDWGVEVTEGINAAGFNTSLFQAAREDSIIGDVNQRWPRTLTGDVVITAGVKNINLEYQQFGAGTMNVYFASVCLFKVG